MVSQPSRRAAHTLWLPVVHEAPGADVENTRQPPPLGLVQLRRLDLPDSASSSTPTSRALAGRWTTLAAGGAAGV
jgi:hypothetical protein